MEAGRSQSLFELDATYSDGSTEGTQDFTVTSSDSSVVSYEYDNGTNGAGYLMSTQTGIATLTFTSTVDPTLSDTFQVQVLAAVADISYTPSGPITIGSTLFIDSVDVQLEDGSPSTTTDFIVTSMDDEVASSMDGRSITGNSVGSATFILEYGGNPSISSSFEITVTN